MPVDKRHKMLADLFIVPETVQVAKTAMRNGITKQFLLDAWDKASDEVLAAHREECPEPDKYCVLNYTREVGRKAIEAIEVHTLTEDEILNLAKDKL
jgi:hypothetical protein